MITFIFLSAKKRVFFSTVHVFAARIIRSSLPSVEMEISPSTVDML